MGRQHRSIVCLSTRQDWCFLPQVFCLVFLCSYSVDVGAAILKATWLAQASLRQPILSWLPVRNNWMCVNWWFVVGLHVQLHLQQFACECCNWCCNNCPHRQVLQHILGSTANVYILIIIIAHLIAVALQIKVVK